MPSPPATPTAAIPARNHMFSEHSLSPIAMPKKMQPARIATITFILSPTRNCMTAYPSINLPLNAEYLWLVSCRRTAMPNAFFVPTRITSFFPLVTAV
jgi:hypothetical protein